MLCTVPLCRSNGSSERFISFGILNVLHALRGKKTTTFDVFVEVAEWMVGPLWNCVAW